MASEQSTQMVRLTEAFKSFPVGTVFAVVQQRPMRASYWWGGEGWPGQPPAGTLLTDAEAWADLIRHAEIMTWKKGAPDGE